MGQRILGGNALMAGALNARIDALTSQLPGTSGALTEHQVGPPGFSRTSVRHPMAYTASLRGPA